MADPAQFGHDKLGHLLSDKLLVVPNFQRRFSWQEEELAEYLSDIKRARREGNSYFMGTIVLAFSHDQPNRQLIIDGQQRITTTALLFAAIRDRLKELGHEKPAQSVDATHLQDYVLSEETYVAKLRLSVEDVDAYSAILAGTETTLKTPVVAAYQTVKSFVDDLSPTASEYRTLIDLVSYLDENVQVLVAVASDLPEAYVIFETLNDRGADLTTADLLKNYIFSQAGSLEIDYAQAAWTRISKLFQNSDRFLKFLRHEYMSRKGQITKRNLYKALQRDIGEGPTNVRAYLERLERSADIYNALGEPDDAFWSSIPEDVRDSLLAFKRFRFETNMPLLLAAFMNWKTIDAARFVDTVASWSVRAWADGSIGGGVAESAFSRAAKAISEKNAKTNSEVRSLMEDFVPDDASFRQAFDALGAVDTTRAKYLLAQIEKQHEIKGGGTAEASLDWSAKSVTVEHIFPRSIKRDALDTPEDFEEVHSRRNNLGNLALLERSLNNALEDKPFSEKRDVYRDSKFATTAALGELDAWNLHEMNRRTIELGQLAVDAWPQ